MQTIETLQINPGQDGREAVLLCDSPRYEFGSIFSDTQFYSKASVFVKINAIGHEQFQV